MKKMFLLLAMVPALVLSSCSDDDNDSRDLAAAVEGTYVVALSGVDGMISKNALELTRKSGEMVDFTLVGLEVNEVLYNVDIPGVLLSRASGESAILFTASAEITLTGESPARADGLTVHAELEGSISGDDIALNLVLDFDGEDNDMELEIDETEDLAQLLEERYDVDVKIYFDNVNQGYDNVVTTMDVESAGIDMVSFTIADFCYKGEEFDFVVNEVELTEGESTIVVDSQASVVIPKEAVGEDDDLILPATIEGTIGEDVDLEIEFMDEEVTVRVKISTVESPSE